MQVPEAGWQAQVSPGHWHRCSQFFPKVPGWQARYRSTRVRPGLTLGNPVVPLHKAGVGGAPTLLTARPSEAGWTVALPSDMVAGGTGWAAATLSTGLAKPTMLTGCEKCRNEVSFLGTGQREPLRWLCSTGSLPTVHELLSLLTLFTV